MYFRTKRSGGFEYLQMVESHRVNGKPRQTVVATLGRLDALKSDFDSYLPKMGLKAALCRGKTWNCALSYGRCFALPCGRTRQYCAGNGGWHVFPNKTIRRLRISPDGGKPSGQRQAAPDRGGCIGTPRGTKGNRRARPAIALRCPVDRKRDAAVRRRKGRDHDGRRQADRPAPPLRETVARQFLPIGDRRPWGR